ncbi:WD repeat-containing protein 44, partial [Bienertia sinuspersici]
MSIQGMVKCIGSNSTKDEFFDSVDHLSAEFDSSSSDLEMGVLSYEFWMNEPNSIKERRQNFLQEMGFVDSCSSSSVEVNAVDSDSIVSESGVERIAEVSEAVSCSSSTDSEVVFFARECDGNNANIHVNQPENDEVEVSNSKKYRCINKKIKQWWKEMKNKQRENIGGGCKCKLYDEELSRTKVHVNKKKLKELSALFDAQEIQAHKGIIWTMKFSPDGQYLATGGEDGVVRVWRIKSVDSCLEKLKSSFRREKKVIIPILVPDKMFKIEQLPVQEFHGHSLDVLDLAWSDSNFLLSSSMDKTVRLWQLGSDACISTFHHTDYVTCVQFNPTDNRYFISGSIDGKVRIWGVSKQRVLDWVDIRDAVTAVCYQPNGQAFVVGSLNGSCRFYEAKGELFELDAHILLQNSKRSSTNRITGIQFSPEDSQRIMVMSEDSKLRILDKHDVVSKFRGLTKSGSQMSASFTSNGRHIISIGQDSSVYVWNHEKPAMLSSSTETKSIRSCEHFYSEGVTVAVPWCGTETAPSKGYVSYSPEHDIDCIARDPPSFSLGNLFGPKRAATWPEDMFPVLNQPEEQCQRRNNVIARSHPTWGLVVVTANRDGMIR